MQFRFGGTLMDDERAQVMRYYGYYDNICPGDIRKLCADADGEEIVLEVNCDGGDLMVGNEIYSILKNYGGEVTAHIQSRSASAATVAMMGADRITAEPVALICVHNPTTYASGEASDMERTAETLSSCKEAILNAYMCRAKVTRKEMAALMDRDIFITAQKAQEYGLVDFVTDSTGEGIILNAGRESHFPTQKMIQEYRERKEKREQETQNQEMNRLSARAFLDKYR